MAPAAIASCIPMIVEPQLDVPAADVDATNAASDARSADACGGIKTYGASTCVTEIEVRDGASRACTAGGLTAVDVTPLPCGAFASSANWTCCNGASTPCGTSQVGGSDCRTEASWRQQAEDECITNGGALGTFRLGIACASGSTGFQGATYRCCSR
jgi:hypothetical protein